MLMTNLSKIALVGAATLLAAACAKEVGTENPNFNAETNEVVTQFVLNVSTQGGAATKMSADAAQADPSAGTFVFRGIDNAKLYSYTETRGEGGTYKGIMPVDKNANKEHDLAGVLSPGSISLNNSRRVLEMSLPLKTNVLLFYGKAPQGNTYDTYSVDDCYGKLAKYTVGSTTDNVDIALQPRIGQSEYTKLTTMENLIAGIMSMLLNTHLSSGLKIDGDDAPELVANTYKNDVTLASDLYWERYCFDGTGAVTEKSPIEPTHERYPLENKLSTLYSRLTTIRSGSYDETTNPTGVNEIRAGSGEAIIKMATDLLTVLNEVRCADPISDAETVAKYFAETVFQRTLKYFAATTNPTGAPITGVGFKNHTNILTAYSDEAEVATRPAYGTLPTGFTWPTATDLAGIASISPALFPGNFNLPRGAAYIAYDKTSKMFYYPQDFDISAMGGAATSSSNAKSYYYPAELLYFGNSPIRTTSKDKEVKDYPAHAGSADNTETTKYWGNEASWGTEWSGDQVEAATRAVAMKYEIGYGVAALETKVKYAKGLENLKDNNHAVQKFWNPGLSDTDEPDKDVPIKENGLRLTGLVIGGQSIKIGWDHLPVPASGTTYSYGFVYDKAIPASAQAVPVATDTDGEHLASNPNYTLLFDNFHASGKDANGIYVPATQDKVYIAVEFQNNTGVDFYGNASLIENGGYFYLIGLLDPTLATLANTVTWPTGYKIPPYTAAGGSQQVQRVFIQDFMTKVTFTLGENSLKYAYLTVPDLRASSMTLGLNVDLTWKNGLDFGDVVLGGN